MTKLLSVVTFMGLTSALSVYAAGDSTVFNVNKLSEKVGVYSTVSREFVTGLAQQTRTDAEHLKKIKELNARALIEEKSCDDIEMRIPESARSILDSRKKNRDSYVERELATLVVNSQNEELKQEIFLSIRLKYKMDYCKGIASILRGALQQSE